MNTAYNIPSPGISSKEALEIVRSKGHNITYATLINWARQYGLGKKVGGRWFIDKEKLTYYLKYGMDENV